MENGQGYIILDLFSNGSQALIEAIIVVNEMKADWMKIKQKYPDSERVKTQGERLQRLEAILDVLAHTIVDDPANRREMASLRRIAALQHMAIEKLEKELESKTKTIDGHFGEEK